MNVPDLKTFKLSALNDAVIRKHYPEFYQYLTDNYPSDLTVSQKMYWYFNGLTDYPKCPICGKRTKYRNINYGYSEYCSTRCANTSPDRIEKMQKGLIKSYGSKENAYKAIREKIKQTNLERYGVENTTQVPKIKEKIFSTIKERYGGIGFASNELNEKQKQKMVELYGVENCMYSEEILEKIKKTNLKKYGTEWQITSEKVKQKIIHTGIKKYGLSGEDVNNLKGITSIKNVFNKIVKTKKDKKSFNISNVEKEFSKYLINKNIKFEYQYKCDRYPFMCDYYLPDYDLFIEIQGMWTHGGHPYDSNSNEDIEKVKLWASKGNKTYIGAIYDWTIRDVNKRNMAKKNNLKYMEIFASKIKKVIKIFEDNFAVYK